MPPARVLMVMGDATSFMLYRVAADGEDAGDTWHQTLEDVMHQVEWEYQGAVSEWWEMPSSVLDQDCYRFGVELAEGRNNA